MTRRWFLALGAVILLAAVLRLPRLDDVPDGFFVDEAAICVNARVLRASGRDVYGERLPFFFRALDDYKAPAFLYTFTAWSVVAGDDVKAARSWAAILGLLSIAATWLLAREVLGSHRGALIACGLLALSPWHLHYSRIAWQAIALVLVHTLAVGFLLRARRARCPTSLVVGAVLLGLCLWTYSIAKLWVVLIGLAWLAAILQEQRPWPWSRRGTLAALGGFTLAALPFAIAYALHIDQVNMRFEELTLLGKPGAAGNVVQSYAAHFDPRFLFVSGDPNPRHSAPGAGQMLASEAPFLLIGLVALARRRDAGSRLVVAWILLAPALGAFTLEAPHASRAIVMLPALQIAVAAGVLWIVDKIPDDRRSIAVVLIAVVLAGGGLIGVRAELIHAPARSEPEWWRPELTRTVQRAQELSREHGLSPVHFLPNTRVTYIDWLYLTRVSPQELLAHSAKTNVNRDRYDPLDRAGRFAFAGAQFPGREVRPGALIVRGPGDEVPDGLEMLELDGEVLYYRAP